MAGSTATVALVRRDKIIVANVGDSRAVLCRNGRAVDLTTEHRCQDGENARAQANLSHAYSEELKYVSQRPCSGPHHRAQVPYHVCLSMCVMQHDSTGWAQGSVYSADAVTPHQGLTCVDSMAPHLGAVCRAADLFSFCRASCTHRQAILHACARRCVRQGAGSASGEGPGGSGRQLGRGRARC